MTIETKLPYSNRENKSFLKDNGSRCKAQLATETNYIPRLSVCSRMNVCVRKCVCVVCMQGCVCVCVYVSQIHEESLSFQVTFLQTP